jgi:hypothetical protein
MREGTPVPGAPARQAASEHAARFLLTGGQETSSDTNLRGPRRQRLGVSERATSWAAFWVAIVNTVGASDTPRA